MMIARRELLTILLSAGVLTGCQSSAPFMAGAPRRRTAAASYFNAWPKDSEPADVGRRVARNFVSRGFIYETNARTRNVVYPEVCTWYGALQVAELIRDASLEEALIRKFDLFLTPEGEAHIPKRAHVDDRVFGAVPLEIFQRTQEAQYLEIGRRLADKQWENTTPDGITTEARYWSDDLYMSPLVQLQAYRATSDPKSMDRSAVMMAAYLDKLQQPNGLFLHSEDSPFYWSRGNGWAAAGMAEMLTSLPEDHPQRARIMEGYLKMMEALLPYQAPEGLWRQLIDQEDFWLESSGTGMFAFAMTTGVKKGWLDAAKFGPAARKAWLGIVSYLDVDANIREVCVGTSKAFNEVGADPTAQRKYYFDRPRRVGDLHGQAPVLWTAAALLR